MSHERKTNDTVWDGAKFGPLSALDVDTDQAGELLYTDGSGTIQRLARPSDYATVTNPYRLELDQTTGLPVWVSPP